ncbi:hypothetical protein [Microbacterium sp. NPDC096154]|uniref:hypothetical protein n=1 Tax=Microbacterium sp. NPDC096154 TaxID=3155549 RepID=UPI00331BF5B7
MSLREELLGQPAPPEPRGFTLLVPPDWGRFHANDEGRRELERILSERFRSVGRPDLDGQMRSMLRRQWTRLQQVKAFSIYMPVTPTIEGATPMSVVVAPWSTNGGDFESDVRQRAESAVERSDTEVGPVYRWQSEQRGEGDLGDAHTRQVSYVFPFPAPKPRRGMLVRASILHPGEEQGGEALTAFTGLADAIAETFRWRM